MLSPSMENSILFDTVWLLSFAFSSLDLLPLRQLCAAALSLLLCACVIAAFVLGCASCFYGGEPWQESFSCIYYNLRRENSQDENAQSPISTLIRIECGAFYLYPLQYTRVISRGTAKPLRKNKEASALISHGGRNEGKKICFA